MTERSVVVRLKADTSSYTAKMIAAGKTAEGALLGATQAAEKNRAALRTVGTAAGLVGAAAAVGVGMAVKAAADFDQAMSGVEAATHASGREMTQLRELALDMGAKTAYSATEAADGVEQLAKAGVSTRDIMAGGLKGALSLAAAGQIEVGDAAEAAATAMTQFGLKGTQVPHVADLLAAAAGKAQGEVSDFSAALSQGGLVADQTGLSIEETTGALAAFASKGLLGSDAGTSLKTMLQSLTPASEKAEQAMEENGISAYNAQGNFIGLEKWAGRLRDGLSGMSDEQRNATLKTVFGSDAVRAASVIYEEGAGGIQRWINKVNDAGYAAETAAIKQDNLAGDLEKLKGAFETALIGTGEGAQGPLRGLIQGLTGVIDAYNKLPQPVKTATLELGAFIALTGGAAFLGTRFIGAIADAKLAMTQLGISAGRAKLAVRGLGLAAAAFAGYEIVKFIQDATTADTARPALDDLSRGLENLGKASGEAKKNALPAFDDLGQAVDRLAGYSEQGVFETLGKRFVGAFSTNSVTGLKEDVVALDKALAGLVESRGPAAAAAAFRNLARVKGLDAEQTRNLLSMLPGYHHALAEVTQENKRDAGATREGTQATNSNADARRRISSAIDTQTKRLDDLVKAQRAAAEEEVQSVYDKAGLISQLRETTKAITQGTRTLNWNTKAGVDNRVALADLAAQWNNSGAKVQDAKGAYGNIRKEFIRLAEQAGATRKQAENLADKLLQVPPTTKSEVDLPNIKQVMDELSNLRGDLNNLPDGKPKVTLDTSAARAEMARWAQDMSSKLRGIQDEDVRISLATSAASILHTAQGLNIFGKAEGGPIRGGVPGRDSVLAMLTPEEHVWTVDEVEGAGGHEVMRRMRRAAKHHALPDPRDLPAFNAGGQVSLRPRVSGTGMAASTAVVERLATSLAGSIGDALSHKLNEALKFGGGQPLGPGGSLSAGQLVRGQMGVRSQEGKPYVWGGTGPGGYDCSGLQSYAYNYAVGMANPYTRRGSTGTMPWGGMKPGTGGYTIGWFTGDPGHMSGNMGGLNIESSGDVGVHTGSSARSPLDPMFNGLAHYDTAPRLKPGLTLAYNGTGADEYVVKGFAGGGEVTRAERKQRREERDQRRQERREEHRAELRDARQEAREKAREEEKEARQLAREQKHAQTSGLRQFRIGDRFDSGEVRSEIAELRSTIRGAFGKDSGAVKAINRLDDRMLHVAKTHDRLIRTNEQLSDHLAGLRQDQRQYAAGVASLFRNDAFGGTLADLSLQLRADTNDAQASRRALNRARQHGLSGGLFAQLAASGNLALEQQFAHLSRRQIARYERQFAQRQQASGAVGTMAGREVYGDRIHDNSRALHRNERALNHNTRHMRRLARTMEHRVERSSNRARRRARSG